MKKFTEFWDSVEKLRKYVNLSDYKHLVVGLLFIRYLSYRFEALYDKLERESEDPEDKENYLSRNSFWLPKKSRWVYISQEKENCGKIINDAAETIEKENPSLKDVIPKDYSKDYVEKEMIIGLVDLIGNFLDEESREEAFAELYDCFLRKFAEAEETEGGEFYTPKSISELLVEMTEPYRGVVYDPCCGTGGILVQCRKFLEKNKKDLGGISLVGQEEKTENWRLAKINMIIRGIDAKIELGDSLHEEKNKDIKADFALADLPFNISEWNKDGDELGNDPRWVYGIPPSENANFAWVQHMLWHLSPKGSMGVVLTKGSLYSKIFGQGDIRKNLVEKDVVDCIVGLPPKIFYNTTLPTYLWLFKKEKTRPNEVLFIDSENVRELPLGIKRELKESEIREIVDTYQKWKKREKYKDSIGFCKSVKKEEIEKKDFVLIPGDYVGQKEEIVKKPLIKEKEMLLHFKKISFKLSTEEKKEIDRVIEEIEEREKSGEEIRKKIETIVSRSNGV